MGCRQGLHMLNEQQLEELCLGWFQDAGWRFAHGPDIAPDSSAPERTDYRQVVLRERLLTALARINPHIRPPRWSRPHMSCKR